jgi:hypothetical protein
MPNGVSPDRPTRLIGDGQAVLSPQGKQLPGGGSAITLLDYARHLHIEGLKVVRHSAPGSVGGIYSGNVQYVTLTRNELADGQIKGGVTSRYLTITHNYIHHTGLKECPQGDTKPTPAGCPHGMYVCGTDHVITDNRVEYCSYYGIQVSCEQGGIARIRLERNIVRHSAAVGIRCGGQDCLVASNLLEANGQGITLSGSGLVAHNTIHGYKAADWNDDPSAIWDTSGGSGSGWQIVNNLLTGQKNSFLLVGNNGGAAIDPGRVHHNMSEQVGNPGVTLIAPVSAIYRDAASGDLSLAATIPALGAGVALPAVPADLFGALYPTPPDLGAISGAGLPPDPGPDPGPEPTPPGAWVCRGDIQAVPGEIQLECQPKQEGRRWRTRDDLSR